MLSDLSPAEYRQTIDAELGMDLPVHVTRGIDAMQRVLNGCGWSVEELTVAWARQTTGYCCEAGWVCAPDPCPWDDLPVHRLQV